MEINIENPERKAYFEAGFSNPNTKVNFFSIDPQDKDQEYEVEVKNITSVEEDEEGICIWWKWWSTLEGKYMTSSARTTGVDFYK